MSRHVAPAKNRNVAVHDQTCVLLELARDEALLKDLRARPTST